MAELLDHDPREPSRLPLKGCPTLHRKHCHMATLDRVKAEIAESMLAISYRSTDQLKPDPKNPRKHSNKQIRRLRATSRSLVP